jgi:GNAT superfamily N-acetyltransferase
MGLRLRPLVGPDVSAFIAASREGYVAERIASGEDATAAAAAVESEAAKLFPGGEPPPAHVIWRIEEDGQAVGTLWIAPEPRDGPTSWWVWDILIDEPHRGRGIGTQALRLAEDHARAQGATELGLTVFGHNAVARHVYEAAGYRTVSMRMAKAL